MSGDSFEKWFGEQEMLVDISLMKVEAGFLRKKEVTPLLCEGARFAWDFKQREIDRLKAENEQLKKENEIQLGYICELQYYVNDYRELMDLLVDLEKSGEIDLSSESNFRNDSITAEAFAKSYFNFFFEKSKEYCGADLHGHMDWKSNCLDKIKEILKKRAIKILEDMKDE